MKKNFFWIAFGLFVGINSIFQYLFPVYLGTAIYEQKNKDSDIITQIILDPALMKEQNISIHEIISPLLSILKSSNSEKGILYSSQFKTNISKKIISNNSQLGFFPITPKTIIKDIAEIKKSNNTTLSSQWYNKETASWKPVISEKIYSKFPIIPIAKWYYEYNSQKKIYWHQENNTILLLWQIIGFFTIITRFIYIYYIDKSCNREKKNEDYFLIQGIKISTAKIPYKNINIPNIQLSKKTIISGICIASFISGLTTQHFSPLDFQIQIENETGTLFESTFEDAKKIIAKYPKNALFIPSKYEEQGIISFESSVENIFLNQNSLENIDILSFFKGKTSILNEEERKNMFKILNKTSHNIFWRNEFPNEIIISPSFSAIKEKNINIEEIKSFLLLYGDIFSIEDIQIKNANNTEENLGNWFIKSRKGEMISAESIFIKSQIQSVSGYFSFEGNGIIDSLIILFSSQTKIIFPYIYYSFPYLFYLLGIISVIFWNLKIIQKHFLSFFS